MANGIRDGGGIKDGGGSRDARTFAAVAVCVLALPMIVPRAALPSVLVAATAAALAYALLAHGRDEAIKDEEPRGVIDANDRDDAAGRSRRRRGISFGQAMPEFAAIDSELYTLRVSPRLPLERQPRRALKHLASHGDLIDRVLRAARLAARNGSAGSGTRALSALEDFFARYHRSLASDDAALAARTLEVLRDTRASALNAINDLTFSVPAALGGPIEAAREAVRKETLRCMATLATKHAPSRSPALGAAAWSAPLPLDPGRERSNSLF